jgi:hypothetical protein
MLGEVGKIPLPFETEILSPRILFYEFGTAFVHLTPNITFRTYSLSLIA